MKFVIESKNKKKIHHKIQMMNFRKCWFCAEIKSSLIWKIQFVGWLDDPKGTPRLRGNDKQVKGKCDNNATMKLNTKQRSNT